MRICQLFVALSAGLMLGVGCEVEQDAVDAEESQQQEERDAEIPETVDEFSAVGEPVGIHAGWTYPTSDERAPADCDPGSMVGGVWCTGGWCDNVSLLCVPTGERTGSSTWTTYFSEEGTNERFCPDGYWVSGLACRGGWCDDVALYCLYYPDVPAPWYFDCRWTGWFSEEDGKMEFPAGYYARGAACKGRRCDDMRFYICPK
jgi:hypothetical protein